MTEDIPQKRVLWVTSSFPRFDGDSTAPFLLEQARGMAARGWQVDVLAPHAPGLARRQTIGPVTVYRFRYMWPASWQQLFYKGGALGGLKRNPFKLALLPFAFLGLVFGTIRRVRAAREEGRPYALLHSHWIIPQALLVGMVSRLMGVPHIATGHGSDLSELRSAPLLWLKRRALLMCDRFHVGTPKLRAQALAICPEVEAAMVPLGVDFDAGLQARTAMDWQADEAPILSLGRLSPEKGVDIFLDSLPHLTGPAAGRPVVVVGGGPAEAELKAQTARLGLHDRVRFVGGVTAPEARRWISRAAVLVMPSRHEGQGMVSIEAQAAGTPIVATAVGGLPNSLNGGDAGRLVPPENPAALAAAISDVFTDPALTTEKVENGLTHARGTFGLDAVSGMMDRLYGEAVTRFEARGR